MQSSELGLSRALETRRRTDSLKKVFLVPNTDMWKPSSEEGLAPVLPFDQTLNELGFGKVKAVDLYSLKTGDLVHFTGFNEHAYYTIKIGYKNKITVWRDKDGKTTGLSASRDDIVVYDDETRNSDEDSIKAYPGFLLTNGYNGIRPRIIMPYFQYDDAGNVQNPDETWMDVVNEIFVKSQE